MKFTEFKLSAPIQAAIKEEGYTKPTPIQEKAIPAILTGKDVMGAAQTGTGKTASFTLPILEMLSKGRPAANNRVRALILTPTRELAAQVSDCVRVYGSNLDLRSTVVYGGVKINPQMMRLTRGADVLVATPGRLLDLVKQNAVRFDQLEILVLDEADRMLDMGFIRDIQRIIGMLPKKRQTLLFSATFSPEVKQLAKTFMIQPVEIAVNPTQTTATSVSQCIHPVDKKRKALLLTHLIYENKWQQVLVFIRTKHAANKLAQFLETSNIKSAAIHGNKSQGARTKALADFKNKTIQVLVATDIAARGLDIDLLPHVVNFDLPNVPEDYVHRIGRTGRAGSQGQAVSLVSADEFDQLRDIENLIKRIIPRKYVDHFEPLHELPASKLGVKPTPPKKPKPPLKDWRTTQQPRKKNRRPSQKKKTGRRATSKA